jgi:hypothetical protein
MKRTLSLVSTFGLLLIASCFEPPQYSIVPRIEFENVRTVEVAGPSTPDSLIITVSFRDGDGDLGRSGTEDEPPFNQKWYYLLNPIPTCEPTVTPPCKRSSFIDESNLANVVKFSTRRTNPDYDTLPAYVKPFICENYEVLRDDVGQIIDTVYIRQNPRTFTYFCDLYTVEAGVPQKYDWYIGSGCPLPGGGFYGRFDVLAKDGDPDLGLPLEGTIAFKVASNTIFGALQNKTLQLRIRIVDRAGHYSNEVTSNNFTLD